MQSSCADNSMYEFTTHILNLYDVVSFDIFDTFLLRPFLTPSDLFAVIGGDAFAEARMQAENTARARVSRPYTIDDIYNCMPDALKPMQAREVAEEKRRLVVNPVMLDVYRKALELGKKVVFTSDMYMTEDTMRDILASKGITEYSGLYVSCTRGCTKYDGSLFRLVVEDLGVTPQQVIHIGDNRSADCRGGELAGVYTYYVPKIADTFFLENAMLRTFFDSNGGMGSLHMRLVFGALVLGYHLNKCEHGDDPWCRTGCRYSALLHYSYLRWVLDEAKKLGKTKLILILRDCHVLGELLARVAPDVNYKYIAAPRALVRPVIDHGLASKDVAAYVAYVKSVVDDPGKSILVEGPSLFRTAERGLCLILGRQLPVRYMNLAGNENAELGATAYINDPHLLWTYGLLEHLSNAPCNPYIGITDGKPVTKKACTPYDTYRNEGVRRREQAAVATAALLHDNDAYLTGEEGKALFRTFLDHTDSQDAAFFINQLVPGGGVNHDGRGVLYWR